MNKNGDILTSMMGKAVDSPDQGIKDRMGDVVFETVFKPNLNNATIVIQMLPM